MKRLILITTVALTSSYAFSQAKIGTDPTNLNGNSLLELESTSKGVLFPRMALSSTSAFSPLTAHVAGMTIYNTATAGDVTPGMYTNNGSAWVRLTNDAGGSVAYQTIKGNVVETSAAAYSILSSDWLIISSGTGTTYTLPTLTLSDAGKTIQMYNNNSGAFANSFAGTQPGGVQTNNQFRGMDLTWTGTAWIIIGK